MVLPEFRRQLFEVLLERVRQPRAFIQVLAGTRQVGKTTLVRQVLAARELSSHYASADDPTLCDRAWIETQWASARLRAREGGAQGGLLVLDEAQKITSWSEVVKRLWDEDTAPATEIYYWRDKGKEVDYVVRSGRSLAAFKVKSGARRATPFGLAESRRHPPRPDLPGGGGRNPVGRLPVRVC